MPISWAVTVTFLTKLEEGVVKSFMTMTGHPPEFRCPPGRNGPSGSFCIEAMMEADPFRHNQQIGEVSFRKRRTPAFKIEHCAPNGFALMIPRAKIGPFVARGRLPRGRNRPECRAREAEPGTKKEDGAQEGLEPASSCPAGTGRI